MFERIQKGTAVQPARGSLASSTTTQRTGRQHEDEAERAAQGLSPVPGPQGALRATTAQRLPGLQGRGQTLAPADREFFEPLWGFDFASVRIHSDDQAARSAHSFGARAYSVGSNIVFGPGGYQPATVAGRHVLAHELAHVVQQSGGGPGLSASPMAVQRLIGDGHDLASPWLAGDVALEGAFDNESGHFLRLGSQSTSVRRVQQLLFFLGFDIGPHGADGIFGSDTDAAVRAFQTIFAPPVDGIIGPITVGALDAQANQPEHNRTVPGAVPAGPPTGTPPAVSVDRINLVDGPAGAIGGFPAIVGGASLNTPGPFNSNTEVKNSLQVHFNVDNGTSADLTPVREIQRTATRATGGVSDNPPDQVLPPGVACPRQGGSPACSSPMTGPQPMRSSGRTRRRWSWPTRPGSAGWSQRAIRSPTGPTSSSQ